MSISTSNPLLPFSSFFKSIECSIMATTFALDSSKTFSQSTFTTHRNDEQNHRRLLEKINDHNSTDDKSFLDTLEKIRLEHRSRLAQVEHDYYHQQARNASYENPIREQQSSQQREQVVTNKPPIPTNTKRSLSPEFATEQRARLHRSASTNTIRQHDDQISFCPHRTLTGTSTKTVKNLSTQQIRKQIKNMWNELGFEYSSRSNKIYSRPNMSTAASWAGRITVPEPFSLSTSANFDRVHRRCMCEIEATKLKKEIDEELHMHHVFRARPVPAHVHVPLYERLQEEQLFRREECFNSTRNHLLSISKPFDFLLREKAKVLLRRHSFSGGDTIRSGIQFRANPVPKFYYESHNETERLKEEANYRSMRRKIRAQDLLEKSRSPFTSKQSKSLRRSKSATDLAALVNDGYAFRPKTNGYYVPDFEKLHSRITRTFEQSKRERSPIKCKPFLLYTNMIPSKKDKIIQDILHDAELKHAKSLEIKGKPMNSKRVPVTSLSVSLQQHEAIPTKMTNAQRLRESKTKKQLFEEAKSMRYQEDAQRSKSLTEKKVRQHMHERTKLQEQMIVAKAERNEKTRNARQMMRQQEESYAQQLETMRKNLQQRSLLMEQDTKKKAVQALEKKIKHAMNLAQVTEQDLIEEQNKNSSRQIANETNKINSC